MSDRPQKPISILIAAMGGEGGGVLSGWLVNAATTAGLNVQATSIPGVAQRTGATTYYVEVWPEPLSSDAPEPLFALYPTPGEVDMMVASELIEAGRAIAAGYVSPERTTLIAATHRVYTIAERGAMGDGRFEAGRVLDASRTLSRRAVLRDFAASGAAVNAVILGAMSATGELPISEEFFRDAIRDSGLAVEANLAGFAAGLAIGQGEQDASAPEPEQIDVPRDYAVFADLPEALRHVATEGARRMQDYQNTAYARRYRMRLERVLAVGERAAQEVAEVLALRMAYDDVIRVAQLKVRPERLARLRAEVGAVGKPFHVHDYLKPGIEEVCALLPGGLARALLRWVDRRGLRERMHVGLRLRSTSIGGYLLLRALAALRPLRPLGYRWVEEQDWIDAWLADVAAAKDSDLAFEIAACGRLLKGYGDTYRRGLARYDEIRVRITVPALAGTLPDAAARLRQVREAALADPAGEALALELRTGT
ncbi:MAG: indolepyruvate oxidoreductase subunit beta family protein [Alphaproteobacteria bacterium]|nr:indolepyruvate oxidoreductase subunit beta family protein [Alphaproteobacteria bacterium]MDP6238945.1 indolepyruvate oxidoreductase subunit beta family protein [Alphaproteobacteria bacterium]MDP7233678.1 indolepyruvate oxidoreductase subunit beta family protein [Alphaproteobacteria bacterium]HJN20721.1 indolepyruvate oxidoreductase subunit beta family protein [Alphaproteobacteria bacterium]